MVVVVGRMDAFSARTGSAGAVLAGEARPATAGSRRPRWPSLRGAGRTAARSAGSATVGVRWPCAGLAARPQRPTGRRGSSRPRRRSGAAVVGQSPGASARGWRRVQSWAAEGAHLGPWSRPRLLRRRRGRRMPAGASAARGGAVAGWLAELKAGGGLGAGWGAKNVFQTPEDRKRPGKDRFPGIDKAGRG